MSVEQSNNMLMSDFQYRESNDTGMQDLAGQTQSSNFE